MEEEQGKEVGKKPRIILTQNALINTSTSYSGTKMLAPAFALAGKS